MSRKFTPQGQPMAYIYSSSMLSISLLVLGNVPALTRLLQAYIKRGPQEIISSNNLVRKTIADLLQFF